ncbi:hypothetical protein N7527_007322, partial [Penicillium freii]
RATIRLNALGEDLNFFDSSLYRPILARNLIAYYILLDCGVSYTFVSIKTARRLGGRSLPVSLPNGETLYTKGIINLVVRLGSRLPSIKEGRERDPKLINEKGRLLGPKG